MTNKTEADVGPKTPRQALKRLRDADADSAEGKIIREQIGLLHQMDVRDRIELLFRFHITMNMQLQILFKQLEAIHKMCLQHNDSIAAILLEMDPDSAPPPAADGAPSST